MDVASHPPGGDPVAAPSALRVLVVDDDTRVRAALVRALDDLAGWQVAAVDTDQAIRLMGLTAFVTDVVVVDVPAAGSRGESLVRRLAPAVPVVAVSVDGAVRGAVERAGACDFVEKDGDERRLVDSIRTAAGSERHNVPGDRVSPRRGA